MQKNIKGISVFDVIYDSLMIAGFIYAHYAQIQSLQNAYYWLFCFIATLAVIVLMIGGKAMKNTYQYSKLKLQYEFLNAIILGLTLAYYEHYVLASILTFFGFFCCSKYASQQVKEGANED